MRAKTFFLTLVATLVFGVHATADATRLVFRVDSATAAIANGHLVISASGAVRSGGWDHPRLLVLEPSAAEASTMDVHFVARPPAPSEVVVQATLPVNVRKIANLPSAGTSRVKIIAETNTLVVQITR